MLSDEAYPFAGEQYIAAGITTKTYPPSVSLEGHFVDGSLSERLFVSPVLLKPSVADSLLRPC